mmetsp:Transcript_27532/g.49974  ORF Transcript_27532/g.49974 Transcript_27532/m.49974 type:complete len:207 (-) Transcript_27532:807-1427(-)
MLTIATFFTALEQSGWRVRVVTRKAPACGLASTLTRHPTLILFPFTSLAPVRKVAAPDTVHGVGSQPPHLPNLRPSVIILIMRSMYSSSIVVMLVDGLTTSWHSRSCPSRLFQRCINAPGSSVTGSIKHVATIGRRRGYSCFEPSRCVSGNSNDTLMAGASSKGAITSTSKSSLACVFGSIVHPSEEPSPSSTSPSVPCFCILRCS